MYETEDGHVFYGQEECQRDAKRRYGSDLKSKSCQEHKQDSLKQLTTAELELAKLQDLLLDVRLEYDGLMQKLQDIILPGMVKLDLDTDLWAKACATHLQRLTHGATALLSWCTLEDKAVLFRVDPHGQNHARYSEDT